MSSSYATPQPASAQLIPALQEIRTLGIFDPDLAIPQEIRRALRIPEGFSPQEARQVLHKTLISAAAQLRPEHRSAFLISTGFHRGAPSAAGDRVKLVAEHLRISQRTAYRRISEAVCDVAAILGDMQQSPLLEHVDFVITASRCTVDMRTQTPSIRMERTLLAYREGITHFDEQFYLPNLGSKPLTYRSVAGCDVASMTSLGGALWAARLQFQEPLSAGEEKTFTVAMTFPSPETLDPAMGFVPHHATFHAHIELLFGDVRPLAVERFAGAPPVTAPLPASMVQPVSPITDTMSFTFDTMHPGRSYGVQWKWDES